MTDMEENLVKHVNIVITGSALWLIAALLSLTPLSAGQMPELCSFPETLRTTEWPWKILSTDGAEGIFHRYRRVTFRTHEMRMDYMRTRYSEEIASSYTFTCLEKFDNERFLVSREDESIDNKYTCIQFIYRDINVVQLKFGPTEKKQSNSLCDTSNMEMLDAPLIYYHTIGGYWDERRNHNISYKVCPLEGGYLVKWFDEEKQLGCNETLEPLKFENDCSQMEGIRFHSVNNKCALPDPRLERPHYCFAWWTEGSYTFMLLWQRSDDFDMPCMRFQTNPGDQVDAYIFMDGMCDRTTTISKSASYKRLQLQRFVVPDLCSNENSLCSDHKALPSCTPETASICRSYCRVCQQTVPWATQSFPTNLQGEWQWQGFEGDEETIEFKDGTLVYPSRGTYTLTSMTCRRGATMATKAKEYSLLSTYDNGCSPRVTSAIIIPRSNSVISIHFSPAIVAKVTTELDVKTNSWKFTDDYKWWCANISLDRETNPRNSIYRYWYDIWINYLKVENIHTSVPCDFTTPSSTFSIRTRDNAICNGKIAEATGDRFHLDILDSCAKAREGVYGKDTGESSSHTTVQIQQTVRFYCLSSFKDNYKNQFVISKSPDSLPGINKTILCWFISHNRNIAYWLPIGTCDTSVEAQILRRKVIPYATLHFDSGSFIHPIKHWYGLVILIWIMFYLH